MEGGRKPPNETTAKKSGPLHLQYNTSTGLKIKNLQVLELELQANVKIHRLVIFLSLIFFLFSNQISPGNPSLAVKLLHALGDNFKRIG